MPNSMVVQNVQDIHTVSHQATVTCEPYGYAQVTISYSPSNRLLDPSCLDDLLRSDAIANRKPPETARTIFDAVRGAIGDGPLQVILELQSSGRSAVRYGIQED